MTLYARVDGTNRAPYLCDTRPDCHHHFDASGTSNAMFDELAERSLMSPMAGTKHTYVRLAIIVYCQNQKDTRKKKTKGYTTYQFMKCSHLSNTSSVSPINVMKTINVIPTINVITGETISNSAECYAGLSVRFESSATCMKLVSSRPKNNLQLMFAKTVRVTVVIYVEFHSF